ncbi:MAG: UDP-N-acetylmuramyl pentapeptide synthase, partial [Flavobacteriaceae bacterium]
MKTIQQLISHIESHVISTSGDTKRSIEHISHDSRDIRQNSLFLA